MDYYTIRYRRMQLPKRSIEFVALIAISCTLFLFLHTKSLTSRLREMEDKLQPSVMSASGLSSNNIHQDLSSYNQIDNFKYLKNPEPFKPVQKLNPMHFNNTIRAELDVLFFNRVPKVGSQTLMELIRKLTTMNNFIFHRDAVRRMETIRLNEPHQQEMAEMISDLSSPSVYVKHVCYTNFTKFGLPTPIYINLVRDPIERVISWYYYIRAPWYYVERKQIFPDLPLPDSRWLKKDFETCVMNGEPECTFNEGDSTQGIGDHRRQTLFFCGHDNDCLSFNSVGALEKAKHAVETQYAVVGLMEDINITLSVFESYIPRFFRGVKDLYWEDKKFTKVNKNNFKPTVAEEIKDIVRRNFTREIEFYQFCKQRLHNQYLAVNNKVPSK